MQGLSADHGPIVSCVSSVYRVLEARNVRHKPPGQRAAEAIAANPEMSDRAITQEIGVSTMTVSRARKQTDPHGPVEDQTRIGLDGKRRRLPIKKEKRIHGRR